MMRTPTWVRIEQLVQERLPPDRADDGRGRSRRPTCAASTAAGDDDGHDAEALYHELARAPSSSRPRATAAPMAVRAFNPTRAEHGYEPGGVGPRDQHRGPAVPRRLGQRRARGARPGHRPRRCTRSSAPSATRRRAASPRVLHPREARRRPSRSCTSSSTGAWRPRSSPTSRTRCARCWPTSAASCATSPRCASASRTMIEVARGGRGALRRATRSAEIVAFLRWLARRQLHLPRRARLRAGRRRAARRATARASGCSTTRRARPGPSPVARRDARPEPARARARGRAAARLQDATACRRCTAARAWTTSASAASRPTARSSARRACIGLFTTKAYAEPALRDPAAAPQAAARSSPAEDLIDGSHDYKAAVSLFDSFPKDELLRRARRGPARRGRRAAGRCRPTQGRVLGRRDADGRTASIIVALPEGAATTPRCSSACARFLRRRFDAQHGRRPRGARRGRPRARALHRPPRPGRPARALAPRRRGRDPRARAHVGRPRPRRRSSARHGDERGRMLAKRWTGRLPDSYKAAVDPAGRGRRHRPLRAPVHRRRGLPRRPAQRARAGSRASGCTASAARSSSPRRCRRSSTSACAWSRSARRGCVGGDGADCGCRTSACSARPTARSTSRSAGDRVARVHRGGLARRGGVGLAEPPDHQRRPGLAARRHPARLPQVPPAASARASPRATRTT